MLLIRQPGQEARGEQALRHRPGRRRRADRRGPRASAPPPVAAPPPHDPGDLHLPVDLLAVLGAQELKRLPAYGAAPLGGIHIDDPFLSLQLRTIPPPVTPPARPLPPLTRAARPGGPPPPGPPRGRAALLRRRAEQQPAQRRHALLQLGHLPGQLSHPSGQPGLIRPQRGGRGLQLRDPRLGPPGAGTPVTDLSILIDHRHRKHMIQHTPLQQRRHAPNPACRDPSNPRPHGITDYLPSCSFKRLSRACPACTCPFCHSSACRVASCCNLNKSSAWCRWARCAKRVIAPPRPVPARTAIMLTQLA